jgi:uncharacterized protein with FMN-binding domain
MKKNTKIRLGVQILCILLSSIGFFINFRAIMIVILGLNIFAGTFYCGWICPFGTIQDIFSKLGDKLKIKKIKPNKFIQSYLKFLRYIVFLAVMLATSDFIFTILSYDPRSNFLMMLTGNIPTISIIIVIISFAIASMFFERIFCNYLCFEGAKYGLMSSFRLFRIQRDSNSCVNCNMCNKACPMNIDVANNKIVTSSNCINCFECISSCPKKDTLKYKNIKIKDYKNLFLVNIPIILIILILSISQITQSSTDVPNDIVSVSSTLKDGTYTGSGYGFKGNTNVEVTIKNGEIDNIKIVSYRDDNRWFDRAANTIIPEILQTQSTDVDTVSGATFSSKGIISAIEDAISKAKL